MEKIFVFFTSFALAVVQCERLALLEEKVVAMEKSLYQDIALLRNSLQSINEKLNNVQIINDKLDQILALNMPALQQELDKPTTKSDNNVRPEQIPLNTHNLQTEIKRFRRAFTALKHDFKSNIRTMTTEISLNVVSFINETTNKTLSFVETATHERHALSEDIKNEIIIFKTNQEHNRIEFSETMTNAKDNINKTLQKVYDNIWKMTTDIGVNVATFINETSNRTLSLIETATNERNALTVDIQKVTQSLATKESTSQILTVSQKIFKTIVTWSFLESTTAVRLRDFTIDVSSNTVKGRVEVYYDTQWGTVCDDLFDESNTGAEVVCRQLGLTGGTAIEKFGYGTGPIWLDDVQCVGTESKIFDCPKDIIGTHNCGHLEDVGVECTIPSDFI